jgi:DNA invertase Pin-like site-specific DNA recombinase
VSKKPLRVITYSRCSTDHHDQNPQVQVHELRRYCEARGWEIIEEIVDHGYSGGSADRPGLKRLLTLVRSRKVDGVVVLNLSRLFRSLKHLCSTLEEFDALGATFVAVKENCDYSTASGRLFVQVIGALNEFTRELIRENTLLGVAHARAMGKHIGRPKRRNDEAIRRLRSDGLSIREIANKLGVSTTAVQRGIAVTKVPPKAGGSDD